MNPVAVITGAGRRLGYELASALLDRDFQVFAVYRTETDDLKSLIRRGQPQFKPISKINHR